MIPNIIHFIFGLKKDFGGKPFSFVHYLAVKSAYECNKPYAMYFHYKYEPSGEWWQKARPYLTLVNTEPPQEIFGRPLVHFAHKSDVLRLEILLREGGIYLDMDVVCLNSFEPLRRHSCVMGIEGTAGLCNAVILAQPDAEFLKICYNDYRTFRSKGMDEHWVEHSVILPMQNAQKYPHLVHVEDKFAFYWPNYDTDPIRLWDRKAIDSWDALLVAFKKRFTAKFISASYCIHLWEQLWWDKHLKHLDTDYIYSHHDNFSLFARKILSGGGIQANIFHVLRPFYKRVVDSWRLKDLFPKLQKTIPIGKQGSGVEAVS